MEKISDPRVAVKPFEQKYGQEVVEFIVGIQRDEFSIPISASDQPDLLDIPGFYQNGSGNFWLAVCDNRVVGTIALLDIGEGRAALRKMFVAADFRGNKYGPSKKLLNTLARWSERHKLKEILLGTTSKFLAAHRFYEKNGFKEILKTDLPEAFPVMKVDTKFYRLEL